MKDEKRKELVLNTDGGSRNNPGNAATGFVISTPDGTVLEKEKKYIGIATNNEAEYQALLSGLQFVRNHYEDCSSITIYSDSELMIKQLRGEYKIREPHLAKFADAIKGLLKEFTTFSLIHILRAKNKLADKLVNDALDAVK